MSVSPTSFERAFRVVVGEEGVLSLNPLDPGNWTGGWQNKGRLRGTKYGISARAFPTLDIRNLTLAQARAIYRVKYWDRIAGDALPRSAALLVFDAAVNQGVGIAARCLQYAAGVGADGVVGPETIAAVRVTPLGPLLVEIAARRAVAYAQDEDAPTFLLGWFRRLERVAALAILDGGVNG